MDGLNVLELIQLYIGLDPTGCIITEDYARIYFTFMGMSIYDSHLLESHIPLRDTCGKFYTRRILYLNILGRGKESLLKIAGFVWNSFFFIF